jgi:hypothetical protein
MKKDLMNSLQRKHDFFREKRKDPYECARCLQNAPILYDSGNNPINFCEYCRECFKRIAILYKFHYRKNLSFILEIFYLKGEKVYKICLSPAEHYLVQDYPRLIPRDSIFQVYSPRIKIWWTKEKFFEEVYTIEWASNHILDQIAIENKKLRKKLF